MPLIIGSDLQRFYNRAKITVMTKAAATKAPLYYILDGVRHCEEAVRVDAALGELPEFVKKAGPQTERVRPEMFVFAGCNGAGKTTLIDHFEYDFDGVVNADEIARKLSPENPRNVDLSAGKQALLELRGMLEGRRTFAVETTLSGNYILKQMKAAKALGYDVYLYFIGLADVELHINRVHTRVIEGGHYISSVDILRRYRSSLDNLATAAALADALVIIDNSSDEFVTIAEIVSGKADWRANPLPQWMNGLDLRFIELESEKEK